MLNGQISPDPKVFLEKVSFLALSVDYEKPLVLRSWQRWNTRLQAQQMGELAVGIIPLGSKISPGVRFDPLCSWGCPRLWLRGQRAGGGAGLAGAFIHSQHNRERASTGQVFKLLVGKIFRPGCAVPEHVRCVERELPGRALQPRTQAAGLGWAPGIFLP